MTDPISLAERLQKEKAVIKGAPLSFSFACFIIIVANCCLWWTVFYFHYEGIIQTYGSTVTAKNATIETQKTALERSDKENTNLRQQLAVADLPRGQSGIPLKKRVATLADQLEEFASRLGNNDAGIYGEYTARFEARAKAARVQLDEAGLNSHELDIAILNDIFPSPAKTRIITMATEFRKLAEKTPEGVR